MILCLLVFLFVDLSQSKVYAQVKIRAAYGTPSLSQVVFPLGVHAGMFERNGLSVEPLYIAGRSINLLLSGDVQFGFTGGPQTVLARLSGADLITIAGLNRLGQMIVAHPSIKSPADLVGKKVGIGVFGTTADYGMRLGLRKLNLRANKEVTFIQVGDVPARIAAVTSGAVHAVVLSSFDKHFLEQHGLRLLAETEDIDFMDVSPEQIVSVAVPIQYRRAIQGVLLLSTRPGEIDEILSEERNVIILLALLAFAATLLASFLLARTIAGPMRRLSEAAENVTVNINAHRDLPQFAHRTDEVGQMATAPAREGRGHAAAARSAGEGLHLRRRALRLRPLHAARRSDAHSRRSDQGDGRGSDATAHG